MACLFLKAWSHPCWRVIHLVNSHLLYGGSLFSIFFIIFIWSVILWHHTTLAVDLREHLLSLYIDKFGFKNSVPIMKVCHHSLKLAVLLLDIELRVAFLDLEAKKLFTNFLGSSFMKI